MRENRNQDAVSLVLNEIDNAESAGEKDERLILNLNNLLGEVFFQTGEINRAGDIFQQTLKKIEIPSYPLIRADIRQNLAVYEKTLGDYEKAEADYQRAKALFEKHTSAEDLDYLFTLYNLANLKRLLGRYTESETIYQSLLEIIRTCDSVPAFLSVQVYHNLGVLYAELGDFEAALDCYFISLRGRVKKFGAVSSEYAQILNNLAQLFWRNDLHIAERIFEKSLMICQKVFKTHDLRTAKTGKNLSVIKRELEKYDEACQLMGDALVTMKKTVGEQSPLFRRSKREAAVLEWKMEKGGKARKGFEETLAFFKEKRNVYVRDYIRTLIEFSRFEFDTGDVQAGIALLAEAMEKQNHLLWEITKGLPEEKALKFLRSIEKDTGYLITVLTGIADGPDLQKLYPLLYMRKGMVFEVTFLHRLEALTAGDSELKMKYELYRKKRHDLARRRFIAETAYETDGERSKMHKDLETEINELERKILSRVPELADQTIHTIEDALKETLQDEAAFLDYYQYLEYDLTSGEYTDRNRYAVFSTDISDRRLASRAADLGQASSIEKAIISFNSALLDEEQLTDIDGFLEKGLEVYLWIVPDSPDKKHLYISPDAGLSMLSFEALIIEDGRFLVEEHTVYYMHSAREFARNRNGDERSHTVSIFSDPDFELKGYRREITGDNKETALLSSLKTALGEASFFGVLEGSKGEADDVREVFENTGCTVDEFSSERATAGAMKEQKNPGILHIATHGFFLPRPESDKTHPMMQAGFVLAGINACLRGFSIPEKYNNGIVTAYDTATLDLRQTGLVVLSACESGLGEIEKGEGVMGLRRGFSQAGARSVIMTLWKVSDLYSNMLMKRFYENLKAGFKVADALRVSKLALIEELDDEYGFAFPKLWAGFVCQGGKERLQKSEGQVP